VKRKKFAIKKYVYETAHIYRCENIFPAVASNSIICENVLTTLRYGCENIHEFCNLIFELKSFFREKFSLSKQSQADNKSFSGGGTADLGLKFNLIKIII
jgi:hypothetical protein